MSNTKLIEIFSEYENEPLIDIRSINEYFIFIINFQTEPINETHVFSSTFCQASFHSNDEIV